LGCMGSYPTTVPPLCPPWSGPPPRGMEFFSVIVKNTFLAVIDEEVEELQPRLVKAHTDGVALQHLREAAAAAKQCGLEAEQAAATAAARAADHAAGAPAADAAADGPGDFSQGKKRKWVSTPEWVPTPARAKARQQTWDGAATAQTAAAAAGRSTVMLRNLPNDYNRTMVVELLDHKGFAGKYDFVYLPTDSARQAGLGYAFVNLVSAADAQLIRQRLEGFRHWTVPSSKRLTVGWSDTVQGLEANVERYRNNPIMHECVPDEFKPAVFKDGKRAEFPQPTKRLRKPDLMRQGRPKGGR